MKIKILRQELSDAIGIIKPAIGGVNPIMSMIRLSADKTVTVEAANLDMRISTEIDATIETPGIALIPGNLLGAIAKELQYREISIESDDNSVTVKGDKSQFKLRTITGSDFLEYPEQKDTKEIIIAPVYFARIIREVSTAISKDETRYTLNGMNLDIKKSEVTAVTSDGRRLAITTAEIKNPDDLERSIIIPVNIIPAIKTILGSEDCTLNIAPGRIEISSGATKISSRLIEGRFPDYNQVIPGAPDKIIRVNRESLLRGMKVASLMTDEKTNSAKLHFGESLVVTAINPEGESREEIDLIKPDGKLEIAFNPYYVMDALKSVDDKEVEIDLIDSDSPGVIKAGKLSYVIMPMKL